MNTQFGWQRGLDNSWWLWVDGQQVGAVYAQDDSYRAYFLRVENINEKRVYVGPSFSDAKSAVERRVREDLEFVAVMRQSCAELRAQ